MNRTISALLLLVCPLVAVAQDSPSEIFEQRIMPIFRSPKPSSCIQCHLASVDLKDYIAPSAQRTFTSLRDQGLIDLESPEKSKILKLIEMGSDDTDATARMIHQKQRDAELSAFRHWIQACCKDKDLLSLPASSQDTLVRPSVSDEVIRHARKDRLLDSFVRNVWSQRMRCFPCHTPDEIDPNNPKHKKAAERHAQFEKDYGQRMNLFRESPLASMNALIASSRKRSKHALPLLNVNDPSQSLLVLKPTAKVPKKIEDGVFEKPSSVAPVSHLGGLKMHVNDQSYKAFTTWIADYAKVASGNYQSNDELPADNWNPTLFILRLKDIPESWETGTVVQCFVHQKQGDGWSDAIAFTQGTVTPRRFVNGALFLLRTQDESADDVSSRKSQWSENEGEFKINVYVDSENRIGENPTLLLNEQSSNAEKAFTTKWQDGFRNAVVVSLEQTP